MSILVTGIGFVGAYIVRDLVAAGHQVVLYGFFGGAPRAEGDLPDVDNARYILGEEAWKCVRVVVGDIRDADLFGRTVVENGVTGIIHLASMVAAASERDIPRAIDVNIGGSINVFETAVRHGVERVVWASSINVYGPRSFEAGEVVDDDTPLDPVSAYGSTKAFVENIARRYHANFGLSVVGLRLGKVYGFGEHIKAGRGGGNTWFVSLVENPARGIGPNVVPFGERSLDFHYIEDVADAFVTALNSREGAGCSFVTMGDYRPVREAFDFVRSLAPTVKMTLTEGGEAAGMKAGAQTNWAYRYDASRARDVLGLQPKFSMEDGLRRTVEAYRNLVGDTAGSEGRHDVEA